MQAIQTGYIPTVLLNVLNEAGKISRSHGIPSAILQAQAKESGIPIHLVSSSWEEYEKKFTAALQKLKDQYDLTHAVFGDIDLQAHRDWEEKVCANAGLGAVLPLWKQDRKNLVLQMLEAGIEAMIVSCNTLMGKSFIGRIIDHDLIGELESLGIDPCGENGEYHTLVLDCPLFEKRIDVIVSDHILHEQYWLAQLELQ
jgi:uncharacterized protein (TIGR00290 family)